jgi:hypothetical protein
MTGPKTIRFHWKLQYELTVNTQYGTGTGSGWYPSGSQATFSVQPPVEDGVHYSFQGWSGDFSGTSSSGTLLMDGQKTVSATWSRQFQTALVFLDAKATPITDIPNQVTLSSPSGSQQQFTAYDSIWLDEGAWKVAKVVLHGVDVSDGGTYNPMPKGKWMLHLRVYDVLVNVRGMLFTGATSGVKIQVKLLDGTIVSGVTDSSGQTVLSQLPTGTYDVQASQLLSSGTVRADASNYTVVNIRMFAPMEVLTLVAIGAIAIAVAVMALRFRKPSRPSRRATPQQKEKEEKQAPETEGDEALQGEPPADEGGYGDNSQDDLQVEMTD